MRHLHGLASSAALCLVLAGRSATAAETDFLPDNDNWNGLSSFVELARGLQISTVVTPTLDWNDLSDRDVLLLVHPSEPVDAASFVRFVGRGGRAIIADDFGHSDRLLARLGIRRHFAARFRAGSFHLGNPALPLAVASSTPHPLTREVPYVLTNHPAYFSSSLPTLLGFDDGAQQVLVYDRIGRGTFVALSDPSILINAMLRFEHNIAFATNLLRHTCRPSQDRLVVLTGFFAQRDKKGAEEPAPLRKPMAAQINAALGRVNDFALTAPGMRAIGLVVAGLVGLALSLFLPFHRRPITRSWFSLDERAIRRPVAQQQARLRAAARHEGGKSLRAIVEQELGAALGLSDLATALEPKWVLQRAEHIGGAEARRECQRLLANLAQLPPTEAGPAGGDSVAAPAVAPALLRGTYERANRLFRALGAKGLPPIERSG